MYKCDSFSWSMVNSCCFTVVRKLLRPHRRLSESLSSACKRPLAMALLRADIDRGRGKGDDSVPGDDIDRQLNQLEHHDRCSGHVVEPPCVPFFPSCLTCLVQPICELCLLLPLTHRLERLYSRRRHCPGSFNLPTRHSIRSSTSGSSKCRHPFPPHTTHTTFPPLPCRHPLQTDRRKSRELRQST